MPQYRLTYKSAGTPPEVVEADSYGVEGGGSWLVLRAVVLVIGQPREVVVRRVRACELVSIEQLGSRRLVVTLRATSGATAGAAGRCRR